jgi:hypothetical protein
MNKQHEGWFQVEEGALRKLRDTYDKPSTYRLAFLVYVTLCRIANLEGSEVFTRRLANIAYDAGLSYNAAAKGLSCVEKAGLVKVERRIVEGTKELAPSEYRLVRMFPTERITSPIESVRFPKSDHSGFLQRVSKNQLIKDQKPADPFFLKEWS